MTSQVIPLIVIPIVSALAIEDLNGKNPVGLRISATNPMLNSITPARVIDITLFLISFKRSPPVNMITNYSKTDKNIDEI